jgi:putative ABC transport system ATP-binding protein
MAALVQLKDIVKTYRMGDMEVRALRGVSIDIEAGDLVAVMGSSGSGKSTIMNIVGCLDKPTSGSYILDGRDVSHLDHDDLAEIRNGLLGFVFQNFNLLSRTSALENVELPLLYAGASGKERKKRATEALDSVGLGDRLDHNPNQLSGGQQQRVAIARAIVSRPKLLLADEPTGNLDSRMSIEIMALFQALSRTGITVVLVTHEPDVAEFASRVIIVKDGVVKSDDRHEPVVAVPLPPLDETAGAAG